MEVVLVRWPVEDGYREDLAARQVPRLLLVHDDAPPPGTSDCLEDWIRVPASERDVQARLATLADRAGRHTPTTPDLDDDGVLRFRSGWVPLPPVEARLTGALVERYGSVVTRDHLSRVGWPAGAPGRNALDVHVLRLRRRIEPLGLVIRTIRSRGYLLEGAPAGAALVGASASTA